MPAKQGITKGRKVPQAVERPRLLIVADAVAHTGFATVTHNLANRLVEKYDIGILGINYHGDPHGYQYPIYPAFIGGDMYGVGRLHSLMRVIRPHVTLVINDPWVATSYVPELVKPVFEMEDGTPLFSNKILYTPVDGKHIPRHFADGLNKFDYVIPYTKFAQRELEICGVTQPMSNILHGVDTSVFYPMDRTAARTALGVPADWFIVGCVARNQPRKRLDLLFSYFAEWAKDKPDTVKLYYHGALKDVGWDILDMAEYYGIADRLMITSPNLTPDRGVPTDVMRIIFNSFNVQLHTALGEGFGLPTLEAMACGIPQIVGKWSALEDWAAPATIQIECSESTMNTGGINTVGGVMDRKPTIAALEDIYSNPAKAAVLGKKAARYANESKFSWDVIAGQFSTIFEEVMHGNNAAKA